MQARKMISRMTPHLNSLRMNTTRIRVNRFSSQSLFHSSRTPFGAPKQDKAEEEVWQKEFEKVLKQVSAHVPFTFGTVIDNREALTPPGASLHVPVYKRMFDSSFDPAEFLEGCKIAFQTTRQWLVEGDLDSLQQVMTEDSFSLLKDWYEKLNVQTLQSGISTTGNTSTTASEEVLDQTETEKSESTTTTDQSHEVEKKKRLVGQVESLSDCKIVRIMINFKDEELKTFNTNIVVLFVVKESLALLDELGNLAVGTEEVNEKAAVYRFTKGSDKDAQWKVSGFLV